SATIQVDSGGKDMRCAWSPVPDYQIGKVGDYLGAWHILGEGLNPRGTRVRSVAERNLKFRHNLQSNRTTNLSAYLAERFNPCHGNLCDNPLPLPTTRFPKPFRQAFFAIWVLDDPEQSSCALSSAHC
ncbi:hypothetical protein AVEN_166562-1, partial [Araneus ventricosus]